MPQYDVYRLADGGMVLDCQSDLLDEIGTRFVIPLEPPGETAPRHRWLNPLFEVDGEEVSLVTQFATALRASELRKLVGSLARHHDEITRAIDTLIGGP